MIEPRELHKEIETCLQAIGMHSEHAVNLLMGTAAQESNFKYVRQIGGGPALGYFQMEPATFKDICNNWLQYQKAPLTADIMALCGIQQFAHAPLLWNVRLMIVFARLHYRRVPEALPTTPEGYAAYWKKYYNTYLGKGTEEEFLKNYKRYGLVGFSK